MDARRSANKRAESASGSVAVAASLPPHRFTQHAFVRMLETGILTPDDRVELIEGEIVDMTPSGPRHAEYVDRLLHLFADLMQQVRIRVQGSLDLGATTLVDPDLMLLRDQPGGYAEALPTAADVQLLVEVAEASLLRDRQVKARLYAAAGIADYWIVDVQRQVIVVHREPQGERYDQIQTLKIPADVAPLHFPQKRIELKALFG